MPSIKIIGGIFVTGRIRAARNNVLPVWSTSSGSLGSVKEFDTVTSGAFFVVAVDEDGYVVPVTYSITAGNLPTAAILNATSGVIIGPAVPVGSDTVFTFTVEVDDGKDQVTREFSITVLDNVAPTWTTPAGDLGSRHEAETITSGNFTVIASDPDSGPESLEYNLVGGSLSLGKWTGGGLPTAAELDQSTGDITGSAVTVGSDTTYNFTIDAFDGDKTTNSAFSITVDNNEIPVWQTSNASPIAEVDTGDAVNVTVEATDADSLPLALTYTVTVGSFPTGLDWADVPGGPSLTGQITGTATLAETQIFTIEADDGLDVTTRQFTIIVSQGIASITNSLIFDDDSIVYQSRTFAAGDRTEWTWSGWVKRSKLGTRQPFFAKQADGFGQGYIEFAANEEIVLNNEGGGENLNWETTALYRDVGAWYHIVWSFDSNATPVTNLYVNGVEVTAFTKVNTPASAGGSYGINSASEHRHGRTHHDPVDNRYDGYMSEVHFVDGQALLATDFGVFDANGDWQPIDYAGVYGTNGFHLDYAVAPGTGDGGGTDVSGEENHWTDNSLVAADQVSDTPIVNYCTWNSTDRYSGSTLSNGNLTYNVGLAFNGKVTGTFPMLSGKWYWEITVDLKTSNLSLGITSGAEDTGAQGNSGNHNAYYYDDGNGNKQSPGGTQAASVSYGTSYTTGDVIGVAYDADNGILWFSKNGTWQNSATITEVQNSTTTNAAFSGIDTDAAWMPYLTMENVTSTANFGATTFAETQPTGYSALSIDNLPTLAVTNSGLHFNTVIYNGDSVDERGITGVGFQPDLVWIKSRNGAFSHNITDAVRGANQYIQSNSPDPEVAGPGAFGSTLSFDSDGFSLDNGSVSDAYVNESGNTYVAWNWKANGTGSANTDGSITSTVSANTAAGFSIGTYTGAGTVGAGDPDTIGHGLGVIPKMIIVKNLSMSDNWPIFHIGMDATSPEDYHISLNLSGIRDQGAIHRWNDTAPTTDVFTVNFGTSMSEVNQSGDNYVFYAWSEVEGFSKFGSYAGNGSTNGPFIYCGFRPAYVLMKSHLGSGSGWNVIDAVRDTTNVMNARIQPNSPAVEDSGSTTNIDFLSNGFKPRTTSDFNNGSRSFIFAAFAESPFKTTRAR